MKKLIDWIDQRTGMQGLLHEVLFERIPGGARWRYVWGSTLSPHSNSDGCGAVDGLQPERYLRVGERVLHPA